MKLDCDCGDSGSKECTESSVGPYSRIWRSLESGGRFCVNALDPERCFSRLEDVFVVNLVYKGIL
jgi:hypothetical protein